jgi:hypothetical protein
MRRYRADFRVQVDHSVIKQTNRALPKVCRLHVTNNVFTYKRSYLENIPQVNSENI